MRNRQILPLGLLKRAFYTVGMPTILILDDDDPTRSALASLLRQAGYATEESTENDVYEHSFPTPDYVLLSLKARAGAEEKAAHYSKDFAAPVFCLLPPGQEDLQTLSYMETPIRAAGFLGRIKRLLAAKKEKSLSVLSFGGNDLSVPQKRLRMADKEVRLTEKEVQILTVLHAAEGAPVSREALLQEVWGYHPEMTTHTVETHMYKLRQKIEDNPSDAKWLKTGDMGYFLAGIDLD